MSRFIHLHVHTQYSTLDGASQIPALINKAIDDGMNAMAITDHGNMFGVKEFFNYATSIGKKKGIPFKPIIGCEVYVSPTSRFDKKGKEDRSGNHLILLAKNKTGYYNLVKLVSLGYIEGFYYKPRIDRELLERYGEGLIVSSACLAGEIPQYIIEGNVAAAESAILWFKERFGDDFYLELQRHKTNKPGAVTDVFEQQRIINPTIVELAKKHGIKCIATNDVHFVNENEAEAHDRLLCISTAADVNDLDRMRYTQQEWFKTRAEMQAVFPDLPDALENTGEIAEKVEFYDINSAPIMPDFPLPDGFDDADAYLRHLTYIGAEKRYGDNIDENIRERIDFELETIKKMGYPGYFLIVQDFIAAAREMGVWVGPGRGSAAGSAVAYCLRITDIDPLKYDLLFERFLNPDRISMPDIDIDFDEDGRGLVLQWVTEKYGRERVARVVTFGTMAAKSAIKDVARVQKLSLQEADRLSKLIDELPRDKQTIKYAVEHLPAMKEALNSPDQLTADTVKYAQMLEGTVRHTGVHACGVVIGRDDLTNYIPISTVPDKETNTDILVTQYEGSLIEDVGMMKMDFLGLRTLSIIKDALANIRQRRGIDVDIDHIPLDDGPTYELYSKGETTGTFQFESDGMKKYLRDLRPTKFEDLIAMNALYRPGPMDYISNFIDRKHGREAIDYDIPVMEKRLKDTYGIPVYQEQVMLLSRDLAGFTRGQSDELRKAMGKKLIDKMNALKGKFLEGCMANGHDEKVINRIWVAWEKFAEYAFNKSHATCYSWVAYQTAYLKANFPSEYMAAVLSRNISYITEITKFMDECRRMGIAVLGPDVNESNLTFTVNQQGNIRFGLGAIKGVGANAVAAIVDERTRGGAFKDIYDFVERVNLTACNKKNMEALSQAGAFDNFPGIRREQFFAENNTGETFIEVLLRFGNKMQSDKKMVQNSLFGGSNAIAITRPEIPQTEEWNIFEKLNREKDLIGIYLSAHPLDPFRLELTHLVNVPLDAVKDVPENKEFSTAGLVIAFRDDITKNGKRWGALTLEDFSGSHEFRFFGSDYDIVQKYLRKDLPLFIKGSMQRNFRNELEPKIKSIAYLSDIKEKMLKSVSITLPLDNITSELVNELTLRTDAEKGNTILRFKIVDTETNLVIDMFSRKQRVNLTNEFVEYLESLGGEVKLN